MNNNRAVAINVKDPSLNIRVWDVQSNKDVTGKTVTAGRLLSFRVDSNLDSVYTQRGTAAAVTIKVKDPAGNVYNALIDDTGQPEQPHRWRDVVLDARCGQGHQRLDVGHGQRELQDGRVQGLGRVEPERDEGQLQGPVRR